MARDEEGHDHDDKDGSDRNDGAPTLKTTQPNCHQLFVKLLMQPGTFRRDVTYTEIEDYIHCAASNSALIFIDQYLGNRVIQFDLSTRDVFTILRGGSVTHSLVKFDSVEIQFKISFSFRGASAYHVLGYITISGSITTMDIS